MNKAGQKFLAKPVNSFYILAVSALSLSVIGLVMVFSASSINSLDTKGNAVAIVLRQFAFFAISIPLAAYLSQRTLAQWRLLARFGLLLSAIILLILQIPGVGKTVNGNTTSPKLISFSNTLLSVLIKRNKFNLV